MSAKKQPWKGGTIMKRFILLVAFGLLLAGCGETAAPSSVPTHSSMPPTYTTESPATPIPSPAATHVPVPTATATPVAKVTHGKPQIGGLFSDFYGKYGTPKIRPDSSNASASWFVSEQPSIAINATPNAAGRVTHVVVTELDLETGKTWNQAQMTSYCNPFLPDDATPTSSVGDYYTDGLSINYSSSIGNINELLILGNCYLTAGS
jgi:hypothetical protein